MSDDLPDLASNGGQSALIDSINESTKHVNTFTLSFFATCTYISIAVASTSHEALLLGTKVHLPLLDVDVPLVHFFIMAPILIGLLHLHLLLQEYFLFCKLKLLAKNSCEDGFAARFFPGLPVNSYVGTKFRHSVQRLLRVLRFFIYQVLPLLLLLWVQVQFLPYHGWRTTLCHQVLVILDILLISYYSRKLSLFRNSSSARSEETSVLGASPRTAIRRTVLSVAAAFSLLYAVVPGTGIEFLLCGRFMPGADWLIRSLSLREKSLVRGLDLQERDLRFADFTGSKLLNADLRGADLSGAILVNADLRGAKLMPMMQRGDLSVFDLPPDDDKLARIYRVARDLESYLPVRLKRANLRGAHLQATKLILADLTDAHLEGAHLETAELTEAKLSGAKLAGADLRGVELSRSHLELAILTDAKLTGSRLFNAYLTGADLRGAHLEGADLTQASLNGANLASAHLEAAQLKDASSMGAVFWDAWLQGATSLSLNSAIVRQARINTVDFCQGANGSGPVLTDLRDVNFTDTVDWNYIGTRLPGLQKVDLGDTTKWDDMMARLAAVPKAALPRLKAASERKAENTCLVSGKGGKLSKDVAHRHLLYSEGPLQGPLKDWPPLGEQGTNPDVGWSENEFLADLVTTLWDQACNNPPLAQALAKRALGDYDPADPLLNAQLACEFTKRLSSSCPGFDAIEKSEREKIVEMVSGSTRCPGI